MTEVAKIVWHRRKSTAHSHLLDLLYSKDKISQTGRCFDYHYICSIPISILFLRFCCFRCLFYSFCYYLNIFNINMDKNVAQRCNIICQSTRTHRHTNISSFANIIYNIFFVLQHVHMLAKTTMYRNKVNYLLLSSGCTCLLNQIFNVCLADKMNVFSNFVTLGHKHISYAETLHIHFQGGFSPSENSKCSLFSFYIPPLPPI